MIVVDTSALMAIMLDEPEAGSFMEAMSGASECLLSAMNYLEASMVFSRTEDVDGTFEALDGFLMEAGVSIHPFDARQAKVARSAFARYGKGRHPAALNFGDCAAYALALTMTAPLLFKGDDFARTDIEPAV